MATGLDEGRALALVALEGKATDRVPVGLFTWGFDYCWKAAGIPPWKLAAGSDETWRRTHLAMLERHQPDILFYSGSGGGPKEPTLLSETEDLWLFRDNNSGLELQMRKVGLTWGSTRKRSKADECAPAGEIRSREDADRRVPAYAGSDPRFLDGLARLIRDVGDRALVLPHHSPSYVRACYVFGFERAMETMLTEPELFLYVCNRFEIGQKARMRKLVEAGAEAVYISDGWASCDIISPRMFERFALPYQASIIKAAQEAGLRVILWNEGDILGILEQEASLPMDAFAFEQPRKGADITVDKVRKVFGPERCLFGNLDSEQLLMRNDPDEIERAVAEQIRLSGRENPFVLITGSPIPSNVEPEAVDAMIRAARMLRPRKPGPKNKRRDNCV